jgi:hypothetical protein
MMRRAEYLPFALAMLLSSGAATSQVNQQNAVPATVVATFTQTSPGSDKIYRIENHSSATLVAYSYDSKCKSKHHHYGHADAAVDYAEPLATGMSQKIVTVDASCDVVIASALFADGSAYGNSADLAMVKQRREYARKELRHFTEMILEEANSPNGIVPDLILPEIAAKRSEVPQYTRESEDEIDARLEVLAHLEERTRYLRDRLSQDPTGRSRDFSNYLNLLSSWMDALSGKPYPDRIVHLTTGRRM